MKQEIIKYYVYYQSIFNNVLYERALVQKTKHVNRLVKKSKINMNNVLFAIQIHANILRTRKVVNVNILNWHVNQRLRLYFYWGGARGFKFIHFFFIHLLFENGFT